jgi:hypothetical protein
LKRMGGKSEINKGDGENIFVDLNMFKMGEAFLDLAPIAGNQPYKFSIHLTASTSLTLPRYL